MFFPVVDGNVMDAEDASEIYPPDGCMSAR